MILALDTSTRLGSVAVGTEEGEVRARRFLPRQRAHAEELVPGIVDVLDRAGTDRRQLTGVVVGAGPGSFTGVRVAAATAKGLVRALGIPLWASSSLEAGAVTAGLRVPKLGGDVSLPPDAAGRPLRVLFDARRDRVYAAAYRTGASGIETLAAPRATTVDGVLASEPEPG
ncbi:MAG: tRNA (adenosine(37)-N6)-threonylcarbamoyltransferase complex dimerization subunit type 1 TsaB, partial [Gemmatimonadetes bacterium]|nr:tRNA (adenosine(37)-N6)-threonylcarbamoyltransferase complex dimerization subunit type 1 TsaB [Gemmatimonadota bacterium]NIR78480.1 tRNA (adenosine(37)-N6)-threonylcarbamoyltransferase complex dimerization subunit type 1 TsaB [Gemmatimonadota bacterium]NIT87090.1 tRNA (adenosine(37)-N6)-threonylcarbamoyltransferase complex dimerization subunit type 1 TsaB [Gemmatimonadota bacterium]NIU30932.1 tRNA (adenosine(37)-N6)-threonylcarbamoyltransferase complex dimerization subunit type 1 TsaB [Gemmat